jgi:hypothetical protein
MHLHAQTPVAAERQSSPGQQSTAGHTDGLLHINTVEQQGRNTTILATLFFLATLFELHSYR